MSRMFCPKMRELPYTEGSAAVELGLDVGWLNTVMGSVHMRGLPRWVEFIFGCLVSWLGSQSKAGDVDWRCPGKRRI